MTRITIDGKDYTSDAAGLEVYDLLISENASNTVTRAVSTEITFTGEAYILLKGRFFSSCHSFLNEIPAQLSIDLCGTTVIPGKITADGTKYCEASTEEVASITVYFKGESIDRSALETDYLWEGYADSKTLPIVFYTIQNANSVSALMLRVAVEGALWPLVALSKIIAGVVVAMCKVVSVGDLLFDCPSFDEVDIIDNITETIDRNITGCGKYAPVLLVREAIEYQCQKSGLRFVSSILNDPSSTRYNMAIFSLQGGKFGTYEDVSSRKRREIFDYNSPLLTTFGFLDSIKEAFYADYKIIGDTLFFEPIDFFYELRTNALNIGKCPGLCYEYDSNAPAYGSFQYTPDGFDQNSAIVFNPYHTNKLEFNNPPNEVQKGSKNINLPYSPTKFMHDQETSKRRSIFDFDVVLDDFKSGDGLEGPFNLGGSKAIKREGDPVLSGDFTEGYKLFILESNFNPDDAKVVRRLYKVIDNFFGRKPFYEYNYPLYFRNEDEKIKGTLCDDYGFKWNPRISNNYLKAEAITIDCDCSNVSKIVNNPSSIFVPTEFGKAIPGSIQLKIDHKEGKSQLILSELTILCS